MLPTYQELVKNSRRQQNQIKWRKFLHRLGIHTWKTYWRSTCKVWCSFLFSQPFQTAAIASLQECRFCPTERAVIDNGIKRQEFDVDYIKAGIAQSGVRT